MSINCIQPVQAQKPLNRSYALSLSPHFGFIHGQAEEIVYPDDAALKAELLSQLLWNMKPVWYYGLSLDFSRIDPLERWGFFAGFSLKNGIPGISGIHENRDWMSIENGALTHYSKHDNETKGLFLLDARTGFSLPLYKLLLQFSVNFSYMRFSFSGWDGNGTYAREIPPRSGSGKYHPITDNPDTYAYKGRVINYTQNWITAAPGIALSYYFLQYFSAELSVQISPVIFCAALDEHLTGHGKQFRDYPKGGLFLEPGFRLAFAVNTWLTISADFSWQYITGSRGESYKREPYGRGIFNIQSAEAGAGLSIFDTGLGIRIRL